MVIERSGKTPGGDSILWRDSTPGESPQDVDMLARDEGVRDLWQRSQASPFQHPHWLACWWASFRPGTDEPPLIVQGLDARTGQLIVVGTWYVERRRISGVDFRRLQLVGQSTWTADASPGEVGTLLHDPAAPAGAGHALEAALDRSLDLAWDDFRVSYVDPYGTFAGALRAWSARHGFECRQMIDGASFLVDTSSEENAYWHSRSANTRRALLSKRRIAIERGARYVQDAGSAPVALEELFRLHDARWSGAGLAPRQRDFLRQLTTAWPDVRARVSLLEADGRAVSASLNLDAHGQTCNLQGGFLPDWDPRLSLGKLHLGFELSRAFDDPTTLGVDLLPGRGMRDDYKRAIASRENPVCTYWVLRTRRAHAAVALSRIAAWARRRTSPTAAWSNSLGAVR